MVCLKRDQCYGINNLFLKEVSSKAISVPGSVISKPLPTVYFDILSIPESYTALLVNEGRIIGLIFRSQLVYSETSVIFLCASHKIF